MGVWRPDFESKYVKMWDTCELLLQWYENLAASVPPMLSTKDDVVGVLVPMWEISHGTFHLHVQLPFDAIRCGHLEELLAYKDLPVPRKPAKKLLKHIWRRPWLSRARNPMAASTATAQGRGEYYLRMGYRWLIAPSRTAGPSCPLAVKQLGQQLQTSLSPAVRLQ